MNNHKETAVSLFRFALGINIFLHGAIRFFDYSKFVEGTVLLFKEAPVPELSVQIFAHLIPIIETVIGFFLILGLFTFPSLVAGLLMMITLMVGMCILQKWDIVGLQMNYIVFYAGLISLLDKDVFSLDRVMRRKKVL